MKFSLINVDKKTNGRISGNWVQNYIGTLEEANKRAREVEAVNSYKIKIAIVDEVSTTNPVLYYYNDLLEIKQ